MFALLLVPLVSAAPPNHDLLVELDLADHRLQVSDTLTLGDLPPAADGAWHFVLHAGLKPRVSRGWRLSSEPLENSAALAGTFVGINDAAEEQQVPLEAWRLQAKRGHEGEPVLLTWGGPLDHPLAAGQDYQRGFSETPGTISPDGVYLAGSSAWVPDFGALFSYSVQVNGLPTGWHAVSQGALVRSDEGDERWVQADPTEEAHLVAGPFTVSSATLGKTDFHAYLRSEDRALAWRYQAATRRYLEMYNSILPAYPYPSFSLVENAWETGYGMPGFTLLGTQIIRFPWILTSSYPHEILHNWWGNSVYVDYGQGNWCEGLTSYMADHLLAEQRGEGLSYRRTTLKKYTDFAAGEEDFPLSAFGARSSAASEAVGYGKSMMLFHMLRRGLGDEAFLAALNSFYEEQQFQRASWADLVRALAATDPAWQTFLTPWVQRSGAPLLVIEDVRVSETAEAAGEGTWKVDISLAQAQQEPPWPLVIPVAVTVEGQHEPIWGQVLCEGQCTLTLACPGKPLRVDVDPMFDVMRRLDPLEVEPSLSTVQGADDALFVLPAAADAAELEAWRALVLQWAPAAMPVLDTDLAALPAGFAWVLGKNNRFGAQVAAASKAAVTESKIRVGGDEFARTAHSLVVVSRPAAAPATAQAWVAVDPPAAIAGLARKLPHYGRYSYLVFEGDEPTNVAKGSWEPENSPLVRYLGAGAMPPLVLPEREPLAPLPPRFRAADLGAWVTALADPALEGRGQESPGLEQATAMVEAELARLGLQPAGDDGSYRQAFSLPRPGGPPEVPLTGQNLLALIPGTNPALATNPVLLMAHLDHLANTLPDGDKKIRGISYPGADDNASGVAALLALAGELAAEPPRERPVLLAFTSGEELGLLGARHLLASLAATPPMACMALDTVGRLSSGRLYVLDHASAREWRFIFMGVGYTIGADLALVPEPLDASDQAACIAAGIPGVQLFTGPHADYHRPSDTADKLDTAGMATVTEAAHQVVDYLAARKEPLTSQLGGEASPAGHPGGGHPGSGHPGSGHPGSGHPGGERKVSLGTTPDFAFAGPGVRVQEVRPDSPAAGAGIQSGDILLTVAGTPLTGLRDLATALSGHGAGDSVPIVLRRGEQELTVTATLEQR